jgi:hypothetical protein
MNHDTSVCFSHSEGINRLMTYIMRFKQLKNMIFKEHRNWTHMLTLVPWGQFAVFFYTSKNCHVSPCNPHYDAIVDMPIMQAAATYMHRDTGTKNILILIC